MADDGMQGVTIDKKFLEDAVIVRMSGQLREVGADQLRGALDELLEEGYCKIVFDLSELSFISSVGLGQMMRAFRAATASDGFVRIVNPQPLVEEVFRFTKLHTLIAIFPTVEDALAAE